MFIACSLPALLLSVSPLLQLRLLPPDAIRSFRCLCSPYNCRRCCYWYDRRCNSCYYYQFVCYCRRYRYYCQLLSASTASMPNNATTAITASCYLIVTMLYRNWSPVLLLSVSALLQLLLLPPDATWSFRI